MFALSLSGFLTFLNSAILLVGYISNNSLFPEPLSSEDEKKYLTLFKDCLTGTISENVECIGKDHK